MLKAQFIKYNLKFKIPSGTSRGVLTDKESWFLRITDTENDKSGLGECSIIRGLSFDDCVDYEEKLKWLCENINSDLSYLYKELQKFPSISFGLNSALLDLENNGNGILFPSDFTESKSSILINGLIWMGSFDFMKSQIEEKVRKGFSCIKIKIGSIDFNEELRILKFIRTEYENENIELRVDANGAFSYPEVFEKLKRLSEFNIHSIEQPIKNRQWENMADVCAKSPIPVALDEELIGIFNKAEKQKLLETVKPNYLIFKPSMLGNFDVCNEWIVLAEKNNIGWWITSALESNVGLNAIAQWTFTLKNQIHQGLGTGHLYTNNFSSPLNLDGERLFYDRDVDWDLAASKI
ncbi:MAG: o-succinylbenzoate synthase [Saprospiraceae bacterium]|nr:o-succinylbenzoate synthase [Saprospiraceae bacterium]